MIGLGQSVLDAIGEADAVKMCARVITACEWRSASEPAPVEESRLDLVAGRLYLCCQQGYDQSCRPMLRRKSPKNRLIAWRQPLALSRSSRITYPTPGPALGRIHSGWLSKETRANCSQARDGALSVHDAEELTINRFDESGQAITCLLLFKTEPVLISIRQELARMYDIGRRQMHRQLSTSRLVSSLISFITTSLESTIDLLI